MTRSVIVPQRRRDLLGRERHHTLAGIDVEVELIEEVAPEETVSHVRRQDARAHGHASDAGFTDLETLDDDELHLAASHRRNAAHRSRRPSDRSERRPAPATGAPGEGLRGAPPVAWRNHTAQRNRRYTTISAAPATSLCSSRTP